MALAPRRSLGEDQWLDALSVAGGRSRRRGAGVLRNQNAQRGFSVEIPEEGNEALWPL